VAAGEICTIGVDDDWWGRYDTAYCAHGCCGQWPDQYCCVVSYFGTVWAIVGGVFGSLLFLCVLLALMCVLCKKASHNGRVIHPTTSSNPPRSGLTVVYNSNGGQNPSTHLSVSGGMSSMSAQPPQPPAYKATADTPAPPPYSDPAYPPPFGAALP
ncbi:hypothetical protein BaRGS_00027824, partial [Batillaria attramentaria]